MARGPAAGLRMSKVRMMRSTPPVATTVELYLFQSWVRTSAGGLAAGPGRPTPGWGPEPAAWTGIVETRWYFADEGVRRSKMRRCESEETAEMRAGLEGQKEAL